MIAYNSYKNDGQWQNRSEEGARVGMRICICMCVYVGGGGASNGYVLTRTYGRLVTARSSKAYTVEI